MRRPWILPALIGLALVGTFMILTAEDDDPAPELDEIVTEEGLATRIPSGWIAAAEPSFEFAPPSNGQVFDLWSVARGCPVDGCGERSLADWIAVAGLLPTFDNVRNADDGTLFNLEAEEFDDARVIRAQTEASGQLVFVAAFTDGAASYVACTARIAVGSDRGLADAIVDVCRETEPLD
jgi:hypothetical protein